jgi:hypothetical protein
VQLVRDGRLDNFSEEKLVKAGNDRFESLGRLFNVKDATVARVVEESECSRATFSTSMFPDMLVMPSRETDSGPSAATRIDPVKVEQVIMSVAS